MVAQKEIIFDQNTTGCVRTTINNTKNINAIVTILSSKNNNAFFSEEIRIFPQTWANNQCEFFYPCSAGKSIFKFVAQERPHKQNIERDAFFQKVKRGESVFSFLFSP